MGPLAAPQPPVDILCRSFGSCVSACPPEANPCRAANSAPILLTPLVTYMYEIVHIVNYT